MGKEQKDDVSQEQEGQTGVNSKVSSGQRNTESQTDGVGTLTLDSKYTLNPNRPDQVFTGHELRTLANQGQQYRDIQSRYDKQQEQLSVIQADKERLERQVQELTAQNVYTRMNQSKGTPPSNEGQDFMDVWGTRDNDNLDVIPPREPQAPIYRNREEIPPINNEITKQLSETQKRLDSLFAERESEKKIRAARDYADREKELRKSQLKNTMPDIPDNAIENIIQKDNLARMLELEASELFNQGNQDGWAERYQEATSLRDQANNLIADSKLEQQRISQRKDFDGQVESTSLAPGVSLKLGMSDTERNYNPRNDDDYTNDIIRQAKDNEATRKRLKQF